MQIFVSWSGQRSKAFASELAKWLRYVVHYLQPWMSDKDIQKGARWSKTIGEKLSECKVGIICVTPENMESPWILFEAGALSKELGEARVCPVLLGMLPSDLEGPLAQFQTTTFIKDDMLKLIKSVNDMLGEEKLESDLLTISFDKFWPDLERKVEQISKIEIDSSNLKAVIDALQGHGFPSPAVGRIICFKEGFESHLIYHTACSLSKELLFIFGRKNRKFFDKEHNDFFKGLKKRLDDGFDLRILTLNPNAPEHIIKEAHEDPDFIDQLRHCIDVSLKIFNKYEIDPDKVYRVYDTQRNTAVVAADNTVLFSQIRFGSSGKVCPLTKCGFEVVDASMPLGEQLLDSFLTTWETAKPVTEII